MVDRPPNRPQCERLACLLVGFEVLDQREVIRPAERSGDSRHELARQIRLLRNQSRYDFLTESDDENTIQELFKQQFKEKCNLTELEVSYFLDNFTEIDYTENNINNYIHLVSFFDYDIRTDFLNHLIFIFKNIAYSDAMKHFDDLDLENDKYNKN